MINEMRTIFYRIREELSRGNLWNFFHTQVFINRIATPVEMALTSSPTSTSYRQDSEYNYIELKYSDLSTNIFQYANHSRRYKALQNFKKGWRCISVCIDSMVVGDVWCSPFREGYAYHRPPDLKMLGIQCVAGEAYAFDMLIDPAYRGKNLAVPLHRYLHLTLKNEGYRKVYGYYWDDNIPAMWMHRMIKFHELPKRRVSRFFLLIHARDLGNNGATFLDRQKSRKNEITKDKS